MVAIGASLIAANISAEQFIGRSVSGFAIGLAIASYEWMSALTLIIVAKYFLPIEMPFPDQMFYTFTLTIVTILMVSLTSDEGDDNPKGIPLKKEFFKTPKSFNVSAYIVMLLLALL